MLAKNRSKASTLTARQATGLPVHSLRAALDMRPEHGTPATLALTSLNKRHYIQPIEPAHGWLPETRIAPMANSFFRNAFDRVVAARERQASRYVNGALLYLDDERLAALGTSREELRRKGATRYLF
jgi:hypothetical protein